MCAGVFKLPRASSSGNLQSLICELQGWKRFFTSTALPGNGGPLRQPRGQTSVFYRWAPGQLYSRRYMK